MVTPTHKSFSDAVLMCDVSRVKTMLNQPDTKIEINRPTTHDHQPALLSSSAKGCLEMVRLLMHHGADITVKNKEGWSALHLSVFHGHLEVASFLLKTLENHRKIFSSPYFSEPSLGTTEGSCEGTNRHESLYYKDTPDEFRTTIKSTTMSKIKKKLSDHVSSVNLKHSKKSTHFNKNKNFSISSNSSMNLDIRNQILLETRYLNENARMESLDESKDSDMNSKKNVFEETRVFAPSQHHIPFDASSTHANLHHQSIYSNINTTSDYACILNASLVAQPPIYPSYTSPFLTPPTTPSPPLFQIMPIITSAKKMQKKHKIKRLKN